MEKKDLANVFEKELKEVSKELEDARRMEAYYKLIGESGVRAENASFERIKKEKLVKYIGGLEDLPSILDIRFASHAKLDQIREAKRQELLDEEYAIEQDMDTVKEKLKTLEEKEKSLTSKKDEIEKIDNGKKINADIYEAKKNLVNLYAKRDAVRKKMKDLASLDYETLKLMLIEAINYSSITMSLEEEIKNKAKSLVLFEKVSENPEKVRNLAHMMMSLHKYSVETYPTHPKYPKQKYLDLDVPDEFLNDIFNNSNVYSGTSESICDIDLALELADEYIRNYKFDMVKFKEHISKIISKGSGTFNKLLEYLDIQEKKESGKNYKICTNYSCARENELIDYFSKDHYDLIHALINCFEMADGEDFEKKNYRLLSKIGSISVKLDECGKGFFTRGKERKLREEIWKPQIEMFQKIWYYLNDQFNNLDIIDTDVITLEKLVSDADVPNDPDLLLDDTLDGIENTFNTLTSIREEFNKLKIARDNSLKDYDERIAKKVEEIKKFAYVKHCNKDLLLTDLKGEDLIDYIYDNAAISAMLEPINEAEKIAREASFDEEAEIRNMSPAELHFIKLEEERKRIARKHAEEEARIAKENESKTKKLEHNSKEPWFHAIATKYKEQQ